MPRSCTSCCHPCAGLRHACCIAVHDNPCKWYPGLPPNPRHPEWGSGFLSENSQDAAYGDDPHQTCEHLVLEGDDDGNTYTCQRDFCETCGERAGWCDAYCGICRSMADPLRGDFPGTRCMSKLIEDTELYREHCISCVTDDATQEMTCTPSCGDVTFTPPCDMCTNDSGFGSNDCETLVGMGVACTRDLGVLTSLFAGVLLQDRCQVTCGICECPAERTINCNSDVVQGDSGIMHAVLSECFGQESSVVRAGYSPFLQCAREAAAVCEPLDCLNLYYDVRDACFGGVLGQRCGFPGPSNGIPTECERAIGVMVGNADRCVGLTPDSFSGHVALGGTDLGPTQTFAQVAAQTRAACMGCDLNAVYEACGRPEWGGGTSADIWDSCSPACGSVAVPFFLNYQSHDNECAGFWSAAGLSAEYEVGGIPGAIERLYNTCNVPCTGVMSPYLGSFGTCNEDGTLAMGSTCEVSCETGATLQGVQPFCMAGGHLVVAGTENGVQTPWEAGSCGCSHDHYQNQLQQACQPCSICPPGEVRIEECGYYHPGDGTRIFTGEDDTQCISCERRETSPTRYANHITHRCEDCRACSAQFPQVAACTYERDTQCARPCNVPAPDGGNLGTCPDGSMEYGSTCDLTCSPGYLLDPSHQDQPECGTNGRLIIRGSVNQYVPLGRAWTAGVNFQCKPCEDDTGLIYGNNCAYHALHQRCTQPYMNMATRHMEGTIGDRCPISCDTCQLPPPPPPAVIRGCMSPTALNYDELATEDDGSCVTFTPPPPAPPPPPPPPPPLAAVYGCMDRVATNYNPLATEDDGSCTVPPAAVYGCMDRVATNYNPLATEDDGSCTVPPAAVYGCMDRVATNYNPLATEDDGSCTVRPPPPPAPPVDTDPPTPPPPPPPLTGACINSNCQNGATCRAIGRTLFSCDCAAGFSGSDCEVNIDDCIDRTTLAELCQNGGVCTDGVDEYACACPDGVTGDNCETAPPPPPPPPPAGCELRPCQNNGDCVGTGSQWSCRCVVNPIVPLHLSRVE